jgi:hypothetical protein
MEIFEYLLKTKWSYLFVLFFLSLGNKNFGSNISLQEEIKNRAKFIKVKNDFYSVTFTSLGGRVSSFVDKDGNEWVKWGEGYGGFFDDRDIRTTSNYNIKVKKSKKEVKVILTFEDPIGIKIEKEFLILEDSSFLKFKYQIYNNTDKKFTYSFMVRNFVMPGGKEITSGQYLFYNDEKGIQKVHWVDLWRKYMISDRWINYPINNWFAIGDIETNSSLVLTFSSLGKIYFWTKTSKLATYEFSFPEVFFEPQKKICFEGDMIVVKGFKYISFASSEIITEMSFEDENINLSIMNFSDSKKLLIKTEFLTFKRNLIEKIENEVEFLENLVPISIKIPIKVSQEAPFIVKQEIYEKNIKIAEYETPLGDPKKLSIEKYRNPKIPLEEKFITFKLKEEDLKNGYFIYSYYKENERNYVNEIDIDLGLGEKEWKKIGINSFFDIGDVRCEIKENNFPGNIEIWAEKDKKIEKGNIIKNTGKEDCGFWLRINTENVKPGNYSVEVLISPEKSQKKEIELSIKVWNIKLPEKSRFSVTFFHSCLDSIFTYLFPNLPEEKWISLWEECVKLLKDTGNNFLEFYPLANISGKLITVEKWDGNIPVLNFSKYNYFAKTARENGMENVIIRYIWYIKNWLPEGFDSFSEKEKERITFSILKQIYDNFKKLGFGRIFYYLIDELDSAKVDIVCERMEKIRKVVPDIEFAGSGFAGTTLPLLSKMSKYLTWIAPYSVVNSIFEWIQTKKVPILPDTILATQFSTHAYDRKYYEGRIDFWWAWERGIDGCQIYSFSTPYKDRIRYACVVNEGDKLFISPNYCGICDGFEDVRYLYLLEEKIKDLKNSGKKKEIDKLIKEIIGEENSILKWKYVSYASFLYPKIEGDEEKILQAKRKLFEILEKIN